MKQTQGDDRQTKKIRKKKEAINRRRTWPQREGDEQRGSRRGDREDADRGPETEGGAEATHRLPRPDPPEEASRAVAQVALAGVARPLALAAALRHGLRVHPAEGVDGVAGDVPELQAGVAPLGTLRRVKPGQEARSRPVRGRRFKGGRERLVISIGAPGQASRVPD